MPALPSYQPIKKPSSTPSNPTTTTQPTIDPIYKQTPPTGLPDDILTPEQILERGEAMERLYDSGLPTPTKAPTTVPGTVTPMPVPIISPGSTPGPNIGIDWDSIPEKGIIAPEVTNTTVANEPTSLYITPTPTPVPINSLMGNNSELAASRAALARAYEKSGENLRLQSDATGKALEEQIKRRLSEQGISEDSGLYQNQLLQGEIATAGQLLASLGTLEVEKATKEAAQDWDIFKTDYAQALKDTVAAKTKIQDTWYNKGITGTVVAPGELEALKLSDPASYNAYQNGISGVALTEFKSRQQAIMNGYTLMFSQIDMDSPFAQDSINQLINGLNGAFGKTDIDYSTTESVNATTTPSANYSATGYSQTDGNNQENFTSAPPDDGKAIQINDKRYVVEGDVKLWSPWTDYDTQYFFVKDPDSGVTYVVVPNSFKAAHPNSAKSLADDLGVPLLN